MKKFMSIIIASLVIAGTLSACSNENPTSSTETASSSESEMTSIADTDDTSSVETKTTSLGETTAEIIYKSSSFTKDAKKATFKDGALSIPYRLSAPENYRDAKLPVLLFLHGSGERGSDNTSQVNTNASILGKLTKDFYQEYPCIIIAPQCPEGKTWASDEMIEMLVKLVNLVCTTYRADTDRVYIMGLSMGGAGTWLSILSYPEVFAAAVPICGWGYPSDVSMIVDMPIWTFHGAADATISVENTQVLVSLLTDAGSTVIKYTEYPGVPHNSWDTAYTEPGLLAWLFSQRKTASAE